MKPPAKITLTPTAPAKQILVVEDAPHVRNLFARWLQAEGYECTIAGDSQTALALLQQRTFDLVTLDITMYGGSGTQLLQDIKANYPDTSAVMLTAIADAETIITCMTNGACGYLVKPVRRDELLFQVRNGLARREEVVERRRAEQKLRELNQQLERRVEDRTRSLVMAHARLKDREARLGAMIDSAADAILTFDAFGQIESFNPAANELFGYSPETLGDEHITHLIPRLDPTPRSNGSAELLALRRELFAKPHQDLLARSGDGREFPIEITLSEFLSGNRQMFLCICRDLTQHRQLQAELSQAQKLEAIGQLAAGIAHEINTPMQYIGDNIECLYTWFERVFEVIQLYEDNLNGTGPKKTWQERRGEIDALYRRIDFPTLRQRVGEAIADCRDGFERVTGITQALTEYSHPGKSNMAPVDLNTLISRAVTITRNRWKYTAELRTEMAPSLPTIFCNVAEINQVLLNLIVNASDAVAEKYASMPEQLGEIVIQTVEEEEHLVIHVLDSGGGIPENIRGRIFDPFFTTKDVGMGTGQGLAICYNVVVKKHGGAIDFVSEVGRGTTFSVRLPKRRMDPAVGENMEWQGAIPLGDCSSATWQSEDLDLIG